jgi:hypothetical protein
MVFWEKSGKEMFYEYLKPNYYTVWRTLYKTEFLRQKNLSFVPGIYCQDKPFTHEVYLKADKCLVVSWPIYIYRRHSESISYSMSERYGKDYCICINKMWSLSSNSELSPTLRQKMMDYKTPMRGIVKWKISPRAKSASSDALSPCSYPHSGPALPGCMLRSVFGLQLSDRTHQVQTD